MTAKPPTSAAVFAARLREVRRHRGLSTRELADRLAEIGHQVSRSTLATIEGGGTRAERVTLAEVLAFCVALNVSPLYMVCPDEDTQEVGLAPGFATSAGAVRLWLRGMWPLGGADERDFFREVPPDELARWARGGEARPEHGPMSGPLRYARDIKREESS